MVAERDEPSFIEDGIQTNLLDQEGVGNQLEGIEDNKEVRLSREMVHEMIERGEVEITRVDDQRQETIEEKVDDSHEEEEEK